MPLRPSEESPTGAPVAEKVRAILASKGLTLYRVSQKSAALYGRSSPNFVPHNLYYDLRSQKFTPSIYQILTLSRISGYRLHDWLQVFGFDLEDITRLQLRLPLRQTFLVDTSLVDGNEWTLWVRNRRSRDQIPAIAPLSQLLEIAPSRRVSSLIHNPRHPFLYAMIGSGDAIAFPEFVPGSIVRVNADCESELARAPKSSVSDRFFLIEHSKGLSCCRILRPANNVIAPVNSGFSHAQVELRVPQEAKVYGYVDLEFRPLVGVEQPHIPNDIGRRWKPQSLRSEQSFGQLVRSARRRMRLSTREAAVLSRRSAELEKDDRYEISSSSMSDYELRNIPPRDLHKILTLCSVYGLQLVSVIEAMGPKLREAGKDSMPDRYLLRKAPSFSKKGLTEDVPNGVLDTLLEAFQNEIPFFLRDLPEYFSGSRHLSMEDFFWIGGDSNPLHPYLVNGLIAIVNRRRKAPVHFLSKPIWQQPIYILVYRDGTYQAACCEIENDRVVIHPYGPDFYPSKEYRNHRDAEVVGQIVAIARRFP